MTNWEKDLLADAVRMAIEEKKRSAMYERNMWIWMAISLGLLLIVVTMILSNLPY